jgi:RHS repeat-associated protein
VAAGSAGFSRLGPPEGGTTSAGVNEVQFAYNDFGQITHDYQAHGGTVNTSTTPKVQFGYASGSANTIRPTTITYPNGRVITYGHGVTDSMSDALSRMAAIIDDDAGSTHLADYSCLGAGLTHGRMPTLSLPLPLGEGRGEGVLSPSPLAAVGRGEGAFVEVDYTEPDIEYTLVGTAGGNDPDTGDIYRGLDRFGRVKDCYWYNYGTSTDVDRIKYGYDRNGNRIWRENVVARSYGKYFDEEYLYDLVDRLKTMDRGELDDLKSQIGNLQFAQRWGLDATGNWRSFLEDSDGDASWNLDQTRTSNKVNEIADINESAGPSWATPAYNRAGNMTTIPKPADPTQSFTATYDAWNRLVKLEDTSGTVAQYEYDGAKRRTVKKTYAAGQLNETRRFYYTEPGRWQVVEERVGTSTNPDRQFVWGPRYIDDLILRDRDTDADGTLDERLYGIQDANWNVTSVAATSGSVEERYAYHAYGTPIIFTAAFAPRGSSDFDWETGFAGYRRDDAVMLFQVRNRVYANGVGTWLQRDPLRLTGDSNLYLYVGGKPIAASDPAGAYVIIIGGIIVGIIIGGIIYWLLNKCLPANVTTPVVPPPIPWPVAPSTEVAAEAAHLFQELWEQKMHSITLVCKALDIIIKTPTHTPAEKRKQEAANFLYGIYCGGPGNVA